MTGAAQGIGEATARRFAEAGARVVLSDSGDGVVEVAADIAAAVPTSHAVGVVSDVTDPTSCDSLVAATLRMHDRLDVLVVAGAVLQQKGPLAELDPVEWDRVMANNARGPFLLCRSAIPALTRPGGAIVLLASFAGEVGLPGYSAYSSSKGAVRLLTQSLALELAPESITVNAIAPAYVESAMGLQALEQRAAAAGIEVDEARAQRDAVIPLGRQATAREIADAMVFLASASYMTGACLDINGGVVLR